MEKKIKSLRLAIIILCSIMLAFIFAGTIMMFGDAKETYQYDSKYGYHYTTTETNPDAGIMPLIGFLFAISGFICVLTSNEKPLNLIGTIILLFSSEIILGVSIIFTVGSLGWSGYFVCVTGMAFAFVVPILSIILMVRSLQVINRNNDSVLPAGSVVTKEEDNSIFAELKKVKELYDMGAITEEEFTEMKKNILQ